MKKWLIVIAGVVLVIFGVFLISDYYSTTEELYVDANTIGVNNYSREDFYTDYLDLSISNQNNEDTNDTSANGSTDAILDTSIVRKPVELGELYTKLASDSRFAAKAEVLATVYNVLEPLYGANFALGMMGNVMNEGNSGVVEYSFSKNHAWGFSLPSGGAVVQSKEDAQYLINWESASKEKDKNGVQKGSCGLGPSQMSFDRRVRLAQAYLNTCSTYSVEEMRQAEMEYMLSELAGKYTGVVESCKGKTAAECSDIICNNYEVCGNRAKQLVSRKANTLALEAFIGSN